MQRNEAISYLKKLIGTDINFSPDSIFLESQGDSKIVKIRIKTRERALIRDFAKKLDLKVEEESDNILVYS